MAQKIFNIIIKLLKEEGADRETVKGLLDIKNAMVTGMAVAGAATTAYYAVDRAMKATVGEFTSYAKGVDVFSSALSTSSEQGSRLIQIADDLGISSDELQASLFRAVKAGMVPTVDGLASMADKYNALSGPTAKADFLTKTFGKSSQELARLLAEGGDAIRARSEAIADSLVLDEEAIRKAREYEAATDDLNGAWMAFKVHIGEAITPVVTQTLTMENARQSAIKLGISLTDNWLRYKSYEQLLADIAVAEQKHTEALAKNQAQLELEDGAFFRFRNEIVDTTDSLEEQASAIKALAEAEEDLRKAIVSQTEWEASFSGAKDGAEQAKLEIDLLGKGIQELGPEGARVWEGFLLASGEIDKPALEAFVRIQAGIATVKRMLDAGFSIDVVVNWLQTGQISGPVPFGQRGGWESWFGGGSPLGNTAAPAGGGTMGLAPWASEADKAYARKHPEIYSQAGLASGGTLGDANIVGEQGWEAIVKRADGGYVVIPHEMSRWLTSQKLLNVNGHLMRGGGLSGQDDGWVPPVSTSKEYSLVGVSSGGGGGGAPSPAQQAVQAVTPVVREVAQNNQRASERQVAGIAQSNKAAADYLREMQALRRDVQGLPERLASQLEKRIK